MHGYCLVVSPCMPPCVPCTHVADRTVGVALLCVAVLYQVTPVPYLWMHVFAVLPPVPLPRWLLPRDDSKGYDDLVSGLLIEEGSPLHGKSARQAGFAAGITAKLTAVSRGGRVQNSASLSDFVLQSGDVLYVTGERRMRGSGSALLCKHARDGWAREECLVPKCVVVLK